MILHVSILVRRSQDTYKLPSKQLQKILKVLLKQQLRGRLEVPLGYLVHIWSAYAKSLAKTLPSTVARSNFDGLHFDSRPIVDPSHGGLATVVNSTPQFSLTHTHTHLHTYTHINTKAPRPTNTAIVKFKFSKVVFRLCLSVSCGQIWTKLSQDESERSPPCCVLCALCALRCVVLSMVPSVWCVVSGMYCGPCVAHCVLCIVFYLLRCVCVYEHPCLSFVGHVCSPITCQTMKPS